jgi:CRISPR-associated protein (TIGR03986 family)
MTTGKLIVNNNNKLQVEFTNAKGKLLTMNIRESDLSDSLTQLKLKAIAQLNGLEVDLEVAGGQPSQVREKGKPFQTPNANAINQNQPVGNRRVIPAPNANQVLREPEVRGDFHNPYNFVPSLPRDDVAGDLGDRNPLKIGMGHGVYQSDRWSGRISVTLTTKTPLLIPDLCDSEEDSHKTFPLRIGADGKPYLPPTSIKGMLRSAYEAVTNSRLGVFEKHSDRLFYRMNATDGLSLVPVRVEGDQISLMCGTSEEIPSWNDRRQRWQLPDDLMYAAWLPRYRRNHNHNVGYEGMQHGDHVRVWLELWQKTRTDRDGRLQTIFRYWLVKKIVPYEKDLGQKPARGQGYGNHQPVPNEQMLSTDGYVCITNQNIERKHDERVFFCHQDSLMYAVPKSNHESDWENLIADYQELHAGKSREDNLIWSRHVIGGHTELKLNDGTLCYAYLEKNPNGYKVIQLYPVMISRATYDQSPIDLLSQALHPATSMDKLSTADRVFGWVNQDKDGKGAYKGNLRIHSVKCESAKDDAIQQFPNGLTLGILGQPKPQQARFYVAKDKQGTPLDKGINKQDGYGDQNGLRGRKVYPHHQVSDWSNPRDTDQEYRQTERSDQNRSIKGWVKPNTNFRFDIDVTNLSSVELGGLLWLLSLPEDHFHRLGGGKPFGFGSVSLNINWQNTDLRIGTSWREFYSNLSLVNAPDSDAVKKTIQVFQDEVGQVYRDKFANVKFIKAFCQAAKGFDDNKPIHYPRLQEAQGESFEWFVSNESTQGMRISLPDLTKDRGLPYKPQKPRY